MYIVQIIQNKALRSLFRNRTQDMHFFELCPSVVMILKKWNKKAGSPCWLKRYDGPILPHLCLTMHFISLGHVTFCISWKQRLSKQYLKKSAVAEGFGHRGNLIYNLWQNHTVSNDTDSKSSFICHFWGHNLCPQVTSLYTLLAISLFASEQCSFLTF